MNETELLFLKLSINSKIPIKNEKFRDKRNLKKISEINTRFYNVGLAYVFFSFFVTFLLTFLLLSFFITSLFYSDYFSFPLYSISSSIIQHYEFNVICQFRLGT